MNAQTIADVMTPNPVVLGTEATVYDAAVAMRDSSIGDVLIADESGLCGIVTDRDIVVRCIANGEDPAQVRLGDMCTPDLVTVRPDTAVDEAVARLRDDAIRRLPVVDGNQVVGIVTIGDLAIDRDPQSALASISEAPPSNGF